MGRGVGPTLIQCEKAFIVFFRIVNIFIHPFLARDKRDRLRLCITKAIASNIFFKPVAKRSWSSFKTGKCTSMNACNTVSKKTKNKSILRQLLMFPDLASSVKSLYSTSEQYWHKAEKTFPSLVEIMSFENGHF